MNSIWSGLELRIPTCTTAGQHSTTRRMTQAWL
jgi:hypothetical protein